MSNNLFFKEIDKYSLVCYSYFIKTALSTRNFNNIQKLVIRII